jgi:HAMP domain-containing protein
MQEEQPSTDQAISQIESLNQELEKLNKEKADLEIMLETITEHSTDLENQIYKKNQELLRYIEQVERVTSAAAAVENDTFQPESLNEVAARSDELGQLARVFRRMVEQVKAREQKLKQQVQELRIEIDKTKQAQKVAEIMETDSFQNLKQKLKRMKELREEKEKKS